MLLSRVLCISKRYICVYRLDTTLTDFTDMKCQRGDLSFIFNGNAVPSESFVVLDNEQKVYQRIHHEVCEITVLKSPFRPLQAAVLITPQWNLPVNCWHSLEGSPPSLGHPLMILFLSFFFSNATSRSQRWRQRRRWTS